MSGTAKVRRRLESQFAGTVKLFQAGHDFTRESSKIVPLGAPFFSTTYSLSSSVHPTHCSDFCRYPASLLRHHSGNPKCMECAEIADGRLGNEPPEF